MVYPPLSGLFDGKPYIQDDVKYADLIYDYCVFDITDCYSIVAHRQAKRKKNIPFGASLYDLMSAEAIAELSAHVKSYTHTPMFVLTSQGIALALPDLVPCSSFGILLFPLFGGDRLLGIFRHFHWDAVFGMGVISRSTRMSSICAQHAPSAEIIRSRISSAFGSLIAPTAENLFGDITRELEQRIYAISHFVGIPIDLKCNVSVNVTNDFDLPVLTSVIFMMATLAYDTNIKGNIEISLSMSNGDPEVSIYFLSHVADLRHTPTLGSLRKMTDRKRMDFISFSHPYITHYKLYPVSKDWSVLGIKQPTEPCSLSQKGTHMPNVHTSAEELIGNTPMLRLQNIEKKLQLNAAVIAKLEYFNPAGSVKDRAALWMINEAEKAGLLVEGSVIIEPTSGNTGIGLCSVAATRGYKVIIVMPETMSEERRKIMKAYGAELVLTEGSLGMKGAIEKAEELAKATPKSFIPDQFNNPANAKAHYETTGPEIFEDTDGTVVIFVAGVGPGGTVTGVGKYLKSMNENVRIVAVEPASSPLLTEGRSGAHRIQGIGANFVPSVLDLGVVDEVITVEDSDAMEMARAVGKDEGVLVGISSGAALSAAAELARRSENEGKSIVVLMPDTGDRYLSTELFAN